MLNMLIFSTIPDKTTLKGDIVWIFFQNLTVLFPWAFPKAISKSGKARRCQRHINALHCRPGLAHLRHQLEPHVIRTVSEFVQHTAFATIAYG